MQSHGFSIVLLILDETDVIFYPLNSGVQVLQTALDFGITTRGNKLTRKLRFYSHYWKLKNLIQQLKPEVIIGTDNVLNSVGYLAKEIETKFFVWEHHHFHWLQKNFFWQLLWRRTYPRLDAVICLNKTEQALFEQAGCRTAVIPNFIDRQEKSTLSQKTILSVGWLIHRKGVDRIPALAKKVFGRHPDWQWIIIGTGEEEAALKNELQKHNLTHNVHIISPVSDDLSFFYRNASLFVMTSRFECFPMVLLEAMSHGIPCLAFDCPTGPSFIISDEVDGKLIEQDNVAAMAAAITALIENEEKRKAFGDAAYENVGRFSSDKIFGLWRNLLQGGQINT